MPPRSFRIVQLSDLHLTPRDDLPRSEPRLFGKLHGMNRVFRALLRQPLVRQADLLLVTGDVTDRGDLDSWGLFWDALEQAGLKHKSLVVPGNHDVCHLGAPRVGSTPRLQAVDLERAREGLGLGGPAGPARFPWARVIQPGRIAVLGLDSNHAGNTSAVTNAVGLLGFLQLEALGRLLRRRDVQACPVKLVALHHSPNLAERRSPREDTLTRWGHEIPQAERRALRLMCALARVRLVLHGHMHAPDRRKVTGVTTLGAPASTQPAPGSAGVFQLWGHTVSGDPPRVRSRLHDLSL
jgi:predicted phosphodiesterase